MTPLDFKTPRTRRPYQRWVYVGDALLQLSERDLIATATMSQGVRVLRWQPETRTFIVVVIGSGGRVLITEDHDTGDESDA